jgi:DNA-binding transcriptional ArsR family regulator
MGANEWNEERASDAARLLHAMAHPKRLLLLTALSDKVLTASSLARSVGISHSTTLKHLNRLVEVGVVLVSQKSASMAFEISSREALHVIHQITGNIRTGA